VNERMSEGENERARERVKEQERERNSEGESKRANEKAKEQDSTHRSGFVSSIFNNSIFNKV